MFKTDMGLSFLLITIEKNETFNFLIKIID